MWLCKKFLCILWMPALKLIITNYWISVSSKCNAVEILMGNVNSTLFLLVKNHLNKTLKIMKVGNPEMCIWIDLDSRILNEVKIISFLCKTILQESERFQMELNRKCTHPISKPTFSMWAYKQVSLIHCNVRWYLANLSNHV